MISAYAAASFKHPLDVWFYFVKLYFTNLFLCAKFWRRGGFSVGFVASNNLQNPQKRRFAFFVNSCQTSDYINPHNLTGEPIEFLKGGFQYQRFELIV